MGVSESSINIVTFNEKSKLLCENKRHYSEVVSSWFGSAAQLTAENISQPNNANATNSIFDRNLMILKGKPNNIIENYINSTVIKGNNSGNHSDFSKEINTSINEPSAINNNKPTKSMQIVGVVVAIIIAIIMIILKYFQIV